MSSAGTQTMSNKEIHASTLDRSFHSSNIHSNTLPNGNAPSLTLPRRNNQSHPTEFEYSEPPGVENWQDRPSSRRSGSMVDDGPFYDSLLDHQAQVHHHGNENTGALSNSNFPGFHPGSSRGESSRCSTLSQATSSLGYGSQRGNHSSPCPSGNVSATYACVGEPSLNKAKVAPRNSYYEYYKRRYPTYPSQFSRGSPHYSSLIDSRHGNTSMPRTHVHYESMKEKPKPAASCELLNSKVETNPGTSTTTVTQNVKSTTNMELELLLPVKNIMKAALQAKKDQLKEQARQEFEGKPIKNQGHNKVTVNVAETGAQVKMGDPKTETQVTTTVDNNGVVETQYYETKGNGQAFKKGIHSTVEIHTNYPTQDVQVVKMKSVGNNSKCTVNGADADNVVKVECA